MREDNVRVRERAREKFELSLDGRQIASIVVGALVILGVVFVLGLNVGRQVALRQAEGARRGNLAELDATATQPSPLPDPIAAGRPIPPPPVEKAPDPEAANTASTPNPSETAAATPSPPRSGGEGQAATAAAPAEKPAAPAMPTPAVARPPASKPLGAYTVQLAASQDRGEAQRIATKFRALGPRIEEAEVPGKGRVYRVRVGSFDSREAAERYVHDVNRETGAKGWVTATR